jgi:DNA-binding GntR family transcriptional regulator
VPATDVHDSDSSATPVADDDWRLPQNLDRHSSVPLYRQLSRQIRQVIEGGSLPRGRLLGNEVLLAGRFGVSRQTARRAIHELVEQGVVVRRRGVGTQVIDQHVARPLRLTSLFDDLERDGQQPQTVVLTNHISIPPVDVANKLRLRHDEPVLHLRRLRIAQSRPLAILENHLPLCRVDLAGVDLGSMGLYQAMRAAGVRMRVANQRIGAREGTLDECELLDEPLFGPLLTMERITHDDSGDPIEFGRHVYRASRYEFTVTLVGR